MTTYIYFPLLNINDIISIFVEIINMLEGINIA